MATRAGKFKRLYGVQRGQKKEGYNRSASDPRYHLYRWEKESKAFRSDHPLCEMCLKKGIYTPAEVVDHIIPVAICKDFWDSSNWQSLCKKHNAEKGNKDKKIIAEARKRKNN